MLYIVICLIKNLREKNSSSSDGEELSDVLNDIKNNKNFLKIKNFKKEEIKIGPDGPDNGFGFFSPKIDAKINRIEMQNIEKRLEEMKIERTQLNLAKSRLDDIKFNLSNLNKLDVNSDVSKAKIRPDFFKRPNFFTSKQIKLENLPKKMKDIDTVKTIDMQADKYYQNIKKNYPNLYEKKTKFKKISNFLKNVYTSAESKFYTSYAECCSIISSALFDLQCVIKDTGILNSIAKLNFLDVIIRLVSPVILEVILIKLILSLKNKKIFAFFEFEKETNLLFFLKFVFIFTFVFFNKDLIIDLMIIIYLVIYGFGYTLAYVIKECLLTIISKLIGPSFNLFPIEFLLIIFSAVWFYIIVVFVMYFTYALFLYQINPLLTQIIINLLKYLK